jgi:hypothetical protein
MPVNKLISDKAQPLTPGEPRTDIVSRSETQQGTTVTHILESQGQALSQARNTARHHSHSQLESQGQALSAGQKHSKAPQPLTTGEPRTGIVSRPETQQGTTATHILESQGQALSAGQQARNTARHHSHSQLESQGQALSAGQKHSKAPQPLTTGEPRTGIVSRPETQQGTTGTGEPRTGIVSRPETQQGTTATHQLESQGQALSAGQKHSKAPQPLTNWRAKDRHCQQARNTARHHSHSHHQLESQGQALSAGQKHSKAPQPLTTGEPRTGIVSRPETQQGTTATHFLESQGQALSAGQKHSKAPQPLTNWRAKDRHCQQARNTARHHSHSLPGEPRTGIVSRPETQQGTTATHILESQGQALSAGQKHSKAPQPLTQLESQGQALSAGQKHSKAPQPLTSWRAKDRHCQQARSTARHHSHSHTGEPRTGIVSRLEAQQGTTATHRLESQGQALSAGQKHSKAPQPLTVWRAKDRHCQQARNTARHHSHSHPGEPRTGIVSRPETQQGTTATHRLESQGQALSRG